MINYIESLVNGVLPWRRIDNMLLSYCIQQIQQDIRAGRPEALQIIDMLGNTRHEQAERFSAWRVRMIDRMAAQYDKDNLGADESNPMNELSEDIAYYDALLRQDTMERDGRK